VRHLAIHQDFGLAIKSYLYTTQKNIRCSRSFIVIGPKKYNSVLAIISDFVSSSIITTNIQRILESSKARL